MDHYTMISPRRESRKETRQTLLYGICWFAAVAVMIIWTGWKGGTFPY